MAVSNRLTTAPQRHQSARRYGTWIVLVLASICVPLSLLATRETRTPVYGYEIVAVSPHDPQAFSQGLVIDNGQLFEGTGQYGRSELRRVDLPTGTVLQQMPLDANVFGEGITVWDNSIIQLTWKQKRAYIYDRKTFEKTGQFAYRGEGWGLTHDGRSLIMSDGSSSLTFLNPLSGKVVRRITVRDGTRRIDKLNELEFVDNEIFANIWYSDYIARIDPRSGRVTGWIDLRGLLPAAQRRNREHVLNGIAWDRADKRLFVTGKYWPSLFEIRIVDPR